MSTYTVTNPTGPSPVRNPGIRATLTARAEANNDSEITEALALITRIIAQPAPNSAEIVALLSAKV